MGLKHVRWAIAAPTYKVTSHSLIVELTQLLNIAASTVHSYMHAYKHVSNFMDTDKMLGMS